MIALLTAMRRDKRGTTSIEYGLICAMIFLAIIGAIRSLGSENGGAWSEMSSKATTAMASTS
jgi:pilus assembly protein Flp/PilA